MPSQTPPATVGGGVSAEGPVAMIAGMGDAAPSLPVMERGVVGMTAWQKNKQITALWSINQNRDAWVGGGGGGNWPTTSTVNYREESDGMIHEMYDW